MLKSLDKYQLKNAEGVKVCLLILYTVYDT